MDLTLVIDFVKAVIDFLKALFKKLGELLDKLGGGDEPVDPTAAA